MSSFCGTKPYAQYLRCVSWGKTLSRPALELRDDDDNDDDDDDDKEEADGGNKVDDDDEDCEVDEAKDEGENPIICMRELVINPEFANKSGSDT
jgi:hypothetical protein